MKGKSKEQQQHLAGSRSMILQSGGLNTQNLTFWQHDALANNFRSRDLCVSMPGLVGDCMISVRYGTYLILKHLVVPTIFLHLDSPLGITHTTRSEHSLQHLSKVNYSTPEPPHLTTMNNKYRTQSVYRKIFQSLKPDQATPLPFVSG
jgi:hypothetical protein